MKHLFRYTIHDKTISTDLIFKNLRRCGIVINGVIHWSVHTVDLGLFTISSDYTKDHFKGSEQALTRQQLEFDTDRNSMNDTVISFEYLTSRSNHEELSHL